MPDQPQQTVIVWLDPSQLPFVQAVAARARIRIVAAGSPARARSQELAEALAATCVDDLRNTLISLSPAGGAGGPGAPPKDMPQSSADQCDLIWLASVERSTALEPAILDAVRACQDRGITIVTSEPIPAAVLELGSSDDQSGVLGPMTDSSTADELDSAGPSSTWPALIPRFRAGKTMPDLTDSLEEFGSPRTIHFECFGLAVECSLGARLMDAMDTIRSLVGEPEEMFALHVPTLGLARAAPSKSALDSLRDLGGTMSAIMRFSDGRSASVLVSDAGGEWRRSLTLLGDPNHPKGGRLRITDVSMEWIGSDGAVLERTRKRRSIGPISAPPLFTPASTLPTSSAIDVFAEALSQNGRRRAKSLPPMNHVGVLAMTGAILLSARTGQAESPITIRRMVGAG
ncbi:MAG: hypothetical protein H7210_13580 [Pyrinomonadaceae bacterium]|nr:hypothetical protein [Phycisphaerales bacterium]